ncbi:MAG: hypothetical protein ACTSVM_05080 [Candidatus Ranarchaeia archaeon]
MSSPEIQTLIKLIKNNSKKELLSFIKSTIEERKLSSEKKLVWKGWLNAAEKMDSSSLFGRLIEGLSSKEIRNTIKELRAMQKIVTTQDPVENKTINVYIREWLKLLREYQYFITTEKDAELQREDSYNEESK